MKTTLKMLGVVGMAALAAVVAGCGGGKAPSAGQAEVFEIQLLGENRGNLSAVLLPVAGVTASANGQQLEVETMVDVLDLAANRQAGLLARVRVPEGVAVVELSVKFDDAGGYESTRGNGAVEARGEEIRWRAPVEWLRKNGRATISMDLRRSLISTADGMRLLSRATVTY